MQERGAAYEAYEGGAVSSLNLSISTRKPFTSSLQASLLESPCPAPVLSPVLGTDVDTFRESGPEPATLLTDIKSCTAETVDDVRRRKGVGIISLWAWVMSPVPELLNLIQYSSL